MDRLIFAHILAGRHGAPAERGAEGSARNAALRLFAAFAIIGAVAGVLEIASLRSGGGTVVAGEAALATQEREGTTR